MKTIRFIVVVVFAMSAVASAQWLKYPTAGIPRTADGKPDLTAPTPRHANGKPVLAGLWRPRRGTRRRRHTRGTSRSGESFRSSRGPKHCSRSGGEQQPRRPDGRCIVGGVPRSDLVGYPFRSSRRPVWWRSSTRPCTRIARSLPMVASCRWIRIRRGSATRSGAGTAMPSSSKPPGSTTTSGWTTAAGQRPAPCV